jgi:hypothetical protein
MALRAIWQFMDRSVTPKYYMNRNEACRWVSSGTQVSSTNKTDIYDMTEILLKEALTPNPNPINQQTNHTMYITYYLQWAELGQAANKLVIQYISHITYNGLSWDRLPTN